MWHTLSILNSTRFLYLARRQEEIKTALQLWEALEERELLGVYNTKLLHELLEVSGGGRKDLLRIVEKYDGLPVHPPLPLGSHGYNPPNMTSQGWLWSGLFSARQTKFH